MVVVVKGVEGRRLYDCDGTIQRERERVERERERERHTQREETFLGIIDWRSSVHRASGPLNEKIG